MKITKPKITNARQTNEQAASKKPRIFSSTGFKTGLAGTGVVCFGLGFTQAANAEPARMNPPNTKIMIFGNPNKSMKTVQSVIWISAPTQIPMRGSTIIFAPHAEHVDADGSVMSSPHLGHLRTNAMRVITARIGVGNNDAGNTRTFGSQSFAVQVEVRS